MLRRPTLAFAPIALVFVLAACGSRDTALPDEGFQYPEARRGDVTDDYHGTIVADPYRWMEESDSEELKTWIAAENKVTFGWLRKGKDRTGIRARIEELWNYEKVGVPKVEKSGYVFRRNTGLQNQSVLYIANSLSGEPRVLLDPNKLSEDGTIALAGTWFSPDGKYMGYSVSTSGSDWQQLRVREVATGEDLPADVINWTYARSASWNAEGSGFYYTRFPEPEDGKEFTAVKSEPKIYYHSVGTAQEEDVLIYERSDQPTWSLSPWVTEDGAYLFVYVYKVGSKNNALFVKDLAADSEVRPLLADFDANYSVIGNDGPKLYLYTNHSAPLGRVVSMDMRASMAAPEDKKAAKKDAGTKFVDVIPQGRQSLESVNLVGDRFIVTRLRSARSDVSVYGLDGKRERKIALPGIGSVWGLRGRRRDKETFFSFSGYTTAPTIYRYDIESGKTSLHRKSEVDFDPAQYFTRQTTFHSKDGTAVNIFISHKRGLKRDGNNPTILYGYGGFDISLTPRFSITNLVWMEMGGVYCVVSLRGGGELGKAWHEAGMLKNKQNVFDDFISAAEALIANDYTSKSKLAMMGGSNGGLLVGAVLNQRPDLFAAALPAVGVMDMLRYQKFTRGFHWISEYGSSEDPDMFPTLYGYSPYHNIKQREYPAVMVTTADHDDRVVPAHSFKYTAALQRAQTGPAPILIRVETKAGHGAGTPTKKRIDAAADRWTFLSRVLGMKD